MNFTILYVLLVQMVIQFIFREVTGKALIKLEFQLVVVKMKMKIGQPQKKLNISGYYNKKQVCLLSY